MDTLRTLLKVAPLLALPVALGLTAREAAPGEAKARVVLVWSTDCPVASRYTERLGQIVADYRAKGVSFEALFPNDLESTDGVKRYLDERGLNLTWSLDHGATEAKSLGAERIPTVFVFDANGRKVYQGALDNHKDPTLARKPYLREALDHALTGKKGTLPSTTPEGCVLMPGAPLPKLSEISYAEHVAPILAKQCLSCHRPGEVAPFSLVGYENARKWAPMIALTTERGKMPPWKAAHGYGEFVGEMRLTDWERDTLKAWSVAGAPRGDAAKEPPTPTFSSEWTLGEPSYVASMPQPFKVPAGGGDVYRNFVIKTDFKETKWITAMDVRPGNKKVVHHVIAFLDERGHSHAMNGRDNDGQDGYTTFGGVGFNPSGALGGWAPGLRPQHTPAGSAFELKPGTTLVLQVHYHPSGKEETDQTKVGLYFADKTPSKPMTLAWIANPLFRIPAGASAHPVSMQYPVRADVTLHSVMPHMHLLGRQMKVWASLPDGATRPIIWIKDWDFNWQLNYALKEPMFLPRGSRIHLEAVYDNSKDNPNNPNDPPKDVRWGEATTDEMFLLVAAVTPGRME